MDDDTTALSTYLANRGLAETEAGYGHATCNEVADAAMEWIRAHYNLEPKVPLVQPGSVQRSDNPLIPT